MELETAVCRHGHTREETTHHSVCRYVPSFMERYDDADPYETVTLTDVAWYCDDCGELLDYSAGD